MNKIRYILMSFILFPCVYAEEAAAIPSAHPFIEYHNRVVVFNLLHQAYERIKPNDFYVGIEGWHIPIVTDSRARHHRALTEIEFRVGHNFFLNGRTRLTPVIGVGVFKGLEIADNFWDDKSHRSWMGYATTGLLVDHEFNSVFTLGATAKALIGGTRKRPNHDWEGLVMGFDVAMPVTFRFGHKRHWDFRLEPFDIYLHRHECESNAFGLRSTIGYRF